MAAQWFGVRIPVKTPPGRGVSPTRALAYEHHFGAAPVDAVICPGPRAVCAELLLAEGRHAEAARLPAAVGDWLDMRGRRNPAWCPGRLR